MTPWAAHARRCHPWPRQAPTLQPVYRVPIFSRFDPVKPRGTSRIPLSRDQPRPGYFLYGTHPCPADRLRRLIANAVRLSQRRNVYAALSQVDSEPVQAVLQRVAGQRIAFLAGLYADLGLPPQRARLQARLAYATYIGLMRIAAEAPAAPLSTEDLQAFTDQATRALLPPAR